MAFPVSPETVWTLFCEIKKFMDEIKAQEDEVHMIKVRILGLEGVLYEVRRLDKEDGGAALKQFKGQQRAMLDMTIEGIRGKLIQVKKILHQYNHKIGPAGLEWSEIGVKLGAPKVYFNLIGGVKELQKLATDLDHYRDNLRDWISLHINKKVTTPKLQPQAGPAALQQATPHPKGKKVNIIFIDKDDVGRSKIALAYSKLLREWTTGTGGHWPVDNHQSAGLNVTWRSECLPQLGGEKAWLIPGNKPPDPVAVAALFDNKLFNHPYKARIREATEESHSHGVPITLFKEYDFIVCFTSLMAKNLADLRQALVKQLDPSAAPKGKGEVVLLGKYADAEKADIYAPVMEEGKGEANLKKWRDTVWAIKVSYKNFLKVKLDWKQPS